MKDYMAVGVVVQLLGVVDIGLGLVVVPNREEKKELHLEAVLNHKEIIGMVIMTQILKNGGIERVKKILVVKTLIIGKKQKMLTKLGLN